MNIFNQLMSMFAKKGPGPEGPIPGAMGTLLASMGIHEIGPHMRRGTPPEVLAGCRRKVYVPPAPGEPAFTREGKPIIAKQKTSLGGRPYHVLNHRGIDNRVWKSMLNDQKRKAAGRWYSGKKEAA